MRRIPICTENTYLLKEGDLVECYYPVTRSWKILVMYGKDIKGIQLVDYKEGIYSGDEWPSDLEFYRFPILATNCQEANVWKLEAGH